MSPKKSFEHALPISQSPSRISQSERGMALIIVLAVLVLLAGLVVAFFSTVTSDASSSAVYSNDARAKQLAESAVNLVMGQIVEATKGYKTGGNTDANRLAWASQPGAIRTYDASGNAFQVFKLYSAQGMVESGSGNFTADISSTWAADTALFTDLNSPVSDEASNLVFPIADPAAIGSVQGFTANSTAAVTVISGNSTTRRLPMPARWVYMLKDGTLTSPTGGSGGNATWTGAAANLTPSATNPIVGRVAFWTDDETSKLNINTASGAPWNSANTTVTTTWGGSLTTRNPANYWDTPIMGSPQDVNLAISQPWQGEFQRYPGHPATISLSAALPTLTTRDSIEALAPRLATGGSRGGGFVADSGSSTTTQTAYKLIPDPDRLYASVDELLFLNPDRSTANATLTAQDLRRSGFFLTASSRAPEVTLFNTPRMVMWPINTQAAKQTAYDKLIAFCGTVGANKNIGSNNSYYFTRTNPDSATVDYNIPRNQQLLSYLRTLTTKAVPGFGGASGILGKYGTDTEQITTEIFDYIRCINTQDSSTQSTTTANTALYYAPSGTIMPTVGAGNTRGFGRFPTLTKAGVIFWFDGNLTNGNVALCARLLLESFIASHGNPSPFNFSNFNYSITGLSSLRWGLNAGNTFNIFPSDSATVTYQTAGIHGRPHGGRISMTGNTQTTGITNSGNMNPPGGFPSTASTLHFTGGSITVTIRGVGNVITQNLTINLPAFDAPFPKDAGASYNGHAAWSSSARLVSARDLVFRPEDVVRSVGVSHGDFRLTAASPTVPSSIFLPVDGYTNGATSLVHNFLGEYPYTFSGAKFLTSNYYNSSNAYTYTPSMPALGGHWINGDAILPSNTSVTGDFDNGYGAAGDGPYIGFADEGNARLYSFYYSGNPAQQFSIPYLDGSGALQLPSKGYFSPNRLVPSAGILGSLPTGVLSQTPWQTLLFRPAALTSASHRGLNSPPDYLLLDLFNMPVVEPYAISEPLSTAGRVNMNYQILPFTYIKRSTAVQAALHTEWLTAIPNSQINAQSRKTGGTTSSTNRNSRWPLNLSDTTGTLKGFEDRFASGDIFRSPAEICSIPLVPLTAPTTPNPSYSSMATWWTGYTLTGDNSKERPYARIYPKLTTKSNSFTVHFRVQVLKKSPATPVDQWVEGRDIVASEYRGSTLIERYIDPNNTSIPDFATNTSANIDDFYRFRVIQTRRFAP